MVSGVGGGDGVEACGEVVVGRVAVLEVRGAVPRVVVLAVVSRKVMVPVAGVAEARVAVSWPVP